MRSAADALRAELRERGASLDPLARVDLALRLGDEDVVLLAGAKGISLEDARRVIARSRHVGRVPSRCHDQVHDAPGSRLRSPR